MGRALNAKYLLVGLVLLASLTSCRQLAITSTPQVEYQDVALSLATINQQANFHPHLYHIY